MYTLAPNVIGTAYTPNLYAYNVAFVNQDANYAACSRSCSASSS